MQNHLDKILETYRDEIAGEAFFHELARTSSEPEHAAKWRTLARLEQLVADRLRTALETHAVRMPTVAKDQRRGLESAQEYTGLTWHEALERLRPELKGYVRDFQATESEMPKALLPLAQFVSAHERALLEFVTRELDQDGHRSLDGVLTLLGKTTPVAVVRRLIPD